MESSFILIFLPNFCLKGFHRKANRTARAGAGDSSRERAFMQTELFLWELVSISLWTLKTC